MKKLQAERKRLIVGGIKVAIGVGVCVGAYVGASMWSSSALQGKTDAESRVSQQRAEIANLNTKINTAESSQKVYVQVVDARKNENFSIQNEQVRDVLQKLIRQYRLSVRDKLEYSAERKVTPSGLTISTPMVVRQDTRLSVSAISDLHVYGFVQALSQELPGIIRFTKFKVTRKGPIDENMLQQLALGKAVYTVDAEMTFDWYGFNDAPVPQAGNAPLPGPGGVQ